MPAMDSSCGFNFSHAPCLCCPPSPPLLSAHAGLRVRVRAFWSFCFLAIVSFASVCLFLPVSTKCAGLLYIYVGCAWRVAGGTSSAGRCARAVGVRESVCGCFIPPSSLSLSLSLSFFLFPPFFFFMFPLLRPSPEPNEREGVSSSNDTATSTTKAPRR